MNFTFFIPIVFAFTGLLSAIYIYLGKRISKKMLCPFDMKCEQVVQSEYSRIFGFPNEILGFIYYIFIILTYGAIVLNTSAIPEFLAFEVILISSFAALFSLYLFLVQIFILKEYCFWCIISMLSNLGILGGILYSGHFDLISIFDHSKQLLVILHLFAMVLGLGGATYTDIFFFRFLKDYKITKPELGILKVFSRVIWVGIALAFISGVGLFIPEMERLLVSTKFQAKVFIFTVLVVNGALFHLYVIPHLLKLDFIKSAKPRIRRFRRLTFAMGAISFVSWYSTFILGSLRSLPWSAAEILMIYFLALFLAISFSLTYESFFHLKHHKK